MGMTAVVTGGRGIGFAVAEELVRQDHKVVLVTRDRGRGEQAVAALGDQAELVVGDLSVLADVRAVAEELQRLGRIDVLVHNAGIWPTRLARTPDGFEQAFAVNHLAPFLLNHLVEARRVVQVSAGLYIKGRFDPARTPTGEDFHRMRTYCTTKLANLMMVPLFAERGLTIDAVHPGVIKTGLGDTTGLTGLIMKFVKRSWPLPAVGAEPVVKLALAEGTGRYFDRFTETPLAPVATDRALARRVWAQAIELAGVS
ncbi:SDR family NAD(P)-dependent oxidoreductase [Kibdelosporangium aridum]|uniref:Short chain dehydrogenase n=1 Tax=Kibdelosporangium aridum TaxID=2030 RepID=A0A1Y5X5T2_KIBAR|nr:SDR family NAD(P)-dependent oxidoreductase [Kibdelosporangium aridum]SMC72777.1 short chain dehydrogenase [Kibdelosporangium aridum]